MSEKTGVKGVVDEALDAAATRQPSAVQTCLPLGGDDEGDDPAGVGAGPLDDVLAALRGAGKPAARGRGRPAGAKNRSTEDWVRAFHASRRSPLWVLADIYSMPVEVLAAKLGVDLIEAMRLQVDAAKAAAPYVHKRLAPDSIVNVTANIPTLILADPALINVQQNQDVSTEAVEMFDNANFDNRVQVIENEWKNQHCASDLKSESGVSRGAKRECEAVVIGDADGRDGTPPPPPRWGGGSSHSPSPEVFSPVENADWERSHTTASGGGSGGGDERR